MESKALVKSMNNIVTSRFFARTLSRIRRIVKICEVVGLFLRKPFWLFLSMLSIFFQAIQFSQKVLIQTIQFSLSMQLVSI